MVIKRDELQAYLHHYLSVDQFSDYCPNGLQVSGGDTIKNLVTGVSANLAFLQQAQQLKADAVLVHHGLFWRGDDPCIKGVLRERLALLFAKDLNLFAYHLPLDCHKPLGNNWQLAEQLGFEVTGSVFSEKRDNLVLYGGCVQPSLPEDLAVTIERALGRVPLHLPGRAKQIKKVAWCTGAGHDFLQDVARLGVDAFITGEVAERTTHLAQELGIHVFAAGHHATERYGVAALGEHLADRYGIKHHFIDVANPI
jgi:dinuclear metal center YbgI/SA1388 family protein